MEEAAKIRAALSVQPCEEEEGSRDRGGGQGRQPVVRLRGAASHPSGP